MVSPSDDPIFGLELRKCVDEGPINFRHQLAITNVTVRLQFASAEHDDRAADHHIMMLLVI